MHFGLYLKQRSIITSEQLVAAAEAQLKALTRIGQLALEEGILAPRDVFDVLRAQCELPEKRFGEVAIELGLMTREELLRLLIIQSERKPSIAEILVAQGVLIDDQVASAMAKYRDMRSKQRAASMIQSKIPPALWRNGTPALEANDETVAV